MVEHTEEAAYGAYPGPDHDEKVVIMRGISKRFGTVQALDHVSFSLGYGEVRALVGENGAGKSTLMNILFGMYEADSGQIWVDSKEVPGPWSPARAIDVGIGMVHQHFSLVPNHTVMENIILPTLHWRSLFPDWGQARQRVSRLCATYGFELNLNARVDELSVGERQQVEILKALYRGIKVLILDEPTGVLTPQQTEALLEFMVEFKNNGHSVVLVTHKLTEAMAVSDAITVLRRGIEMGTVQKEVASIEQIARLMVDRDFGDVEHVDRSSVQDSSALEVKDLVVEDADRQRIVDGVSLHINHGEIVGIAGVAGNGQIDLAKAIVGLQDVSSGQILLDQIPVERSSVKHRRNLGLGFIPDDRHRYGMVMEMSVADNLCLDALGQEPFSRHGILRCGVIAERAAELVQEYNVRTPDIDAPIANLSGGNQQKVILARILSSRPRVIVACEPTRGLDFTAMEYVRHQLVTASQDRVGILLISSDLDELLQLSHRIVVMYRGRIVGVLPRDAVDLDHIGLLMAGHVV